jgi:hypothetical protein
MMMMMMMGLSSLQGRRAGLGSMGADAQDRGCKS